MLRQGLATLFILVLTSGCGTETAKPSPPSSATSESSQEEKLVLVSGSGDLGEADYGQRKTTTFMVANQTSRLLNLFVSDRSCSCASVEIQPAALGPSQTAQVTVAWTAKLGQSNDQPMRLRTTVQAREDPALHIELEATVRLKPLLLINLPNGELNFGRVQLDDLKSGKPALAFEVFTREKSHWQITIRAQSLSPGLQVAAPEPLPAYRLVAHNAVAGYFVVIQPTAELPVGSFREFVRLTSDAYPGLDLDIPVEGIVESGQVSLSPGQIELPAKISIDRGYSCPPLEIKLRDEPGRTLLLHEVEPSFLKVRIVPAKGKDNTWQLFVQVPAGEAELRKDLSEARLSDYISYGFDEGVIVLRIDDSSIPVIRIPVSDSQFRRE